jgi:hypothetical protein
MADHDWDAYSHQSRMVPVDSTVTEIPRERTSKEQSQKSKPDVWNHSEKLQPNSTTLPTRHL